MEVRIRVVLGNEAFQDGKGGAEVARILAQVAERVREDALTDQDYMTLMDVNGNRVGFFEVRD